MAAPIRVLHVEDDPDFASVTADYLERESERIEVETATDPAAGVGLALTGEVDCVVSDYDMPGMDGIEVLERVREEDPDLPFILFTGKGSEEVASEALSKDATDYLQKEVGTDQYAILANRIENSVVQRRSVAELERQDEVLETAQAIAGFGVCEFDVETGQAWFSSGMYREFDVPEQDGSEANGEVPVDDIVAVYHPADRERVSQAFERTIEAGEPFDIEARLGGNGDGYRWVRVRGEPQVEGDAVRQIRATVQDVTDQKARGQELRRTERRFEAVFEDPEMLVGLLDVDGTLRDANETAMDYVEADREAVVGESFWETPWWSEDVREDVRRWVERAADGEYVTFEAEHVRPGGEARTVNGSIRPVTDVDGSVASLIASARDVTGRETSREERAFYEALVEETTDVLTVFDDDGTVQYHSPAIETVLGYEQEELVGSQANARVHPEDREAVFEWFDSVVSGPGASTETIEHRVRHADGSWRWLEASAQNRKSTALDGQVVTSRDVTERKERERELENYEAIIQGLGVSFYSLNEEGDMSHVNPAGANITGYDAEEILEGGAELLYDDEELARLGRAFVELADDDRDTASVEAIIQTKGGEEVPVEHTLTVVTDDDGEFDGAYGVIKDISGRKERVRELESYERIFEGIGLTTIVLDERGEFAQANPAGAEISGYDAEEIIEGGPELLYDDEELTKFERAVEGVIDGDECEGERYTTVEATMVRKDGEEVPVETTLTVLTDEEGRFDGAIGVAQDITERKETERKFREYEAILQAIPDEVAILNTEGFFDRVIPPTARDLTMSGYTREELEGEHVAKAMTDEGIEEATELLVELIETDKERVAFEMEVVTKDGRRLEREDHLSLLRDDDGNIVGSVGVLRDIEERKAYERELERQNERLEEFASIASHDLRNPLNLAQGYMEMVARACDVEHTETVTEALDRMEKLIEDTLTWARQGSTVSERRPIHLPELAPDCWEAVGSEAGTLEVVDDVTVDGEPSRVRQVIENLLRNAVEHGGEDVTVKIGAIDGDGGRRGFYVEDDGAGIPPDERDSVFEAGFTTASTGTGFGLAIIGEIVDAHGWEIAVTEGEEGGARFEITGVDALE